MRRPEVVEQLRLHSLNDEGPAGAAKQPAEPSMRCGGSQEIRLGSHAVERADSMVACPSTRVPW